MKGKARLEMKTSYEVKSASEGEGDGKEGGSLSRAASRRLDRVGGDVVLVGEGGVVVCGG